MELEELKQKWNLLDERLSKSEVYNQRMLHEMLKNNTQTIYERLRRQGVFNLMTTAFVAAVVIPLLRMKGIYRHETTFLLLEAVCTLGVLMVAFRLLILARFNVTNSPERQLQNVVRYKRCYLGESLIGTPIAILTILATLYIEGWRSLDGIYFVLLGTAIGLFCGWVGWQKHRSTMQEIEQNLAELRDSK